MVDCDDEDAAVFPGADEICDGKRNDCDADGVADDELDGDGDGIVGCEGDCDDQNTAVGPGFEELCDRLDNDCDGVVPEDELDSDGDGVAASTSCTPWSASTAASCRTRASTQSSA